ncbi:hypothetical protein ACIQC8_10675 [Agrococcus sediminis]|uniref:hypothetical protein n=1 Tax=Agrococcus sediminis TaxID=2599924 RepID=UPI0038256D4F
MTDEVIRLRKVGTEAFSEFTAVVSSTDAIGALREIVASTGEYLRVREQEQSKRAAIAAVQELQAERLAVAERALQLYFERSYAERADTSRAMFERLDVAIAAGDPQLVHAVVRGVVELAQSSPLAGLEDFGRLWAQIGTAESPFEL